MVGSGANGESLFGSAGGIGLQYVQRDVLISNTVIANNSANFYEQMGYEYADYVSTGLGGGMVRHGRGLGVRDGRGHGEA